MNPDSEIRLRTGEVPFMCSRIVALTFIFLSLATCAFPASGQSWSELIDAANAQLTELEYDSAIALGNKAIEAATAEFGRADSTVATALFETATYYGQKLLRNEARNLLNEALSIRRDIFGENHWTVGECRTGLGITFVHEGYYERAETFFDSALAGASPLAGFDDSMLTANTLTFLSGAYGGQVRYADAEAALRHALEIFEALIGPDGPQTTGVYMALVGVLQAQGYFEEAESIALRNIDQVEFELGALHPLTQMVSSMLADVYWNQNRFDEAEPLIRSCLSILEETMGSDNPAVATERLRLANFLLDLGRYSESESLLDKAYGIVEAKYGANFHQCATILKNKADLMSYMGDYTRAAELYESSLKVMREVFGPKSLKVSGLLRQMAVNANHNGDLKSAISLAREALTLQTELLGPNHRYVASTLTTLATGLRYYGDPHGAEEEYTKALIVLKSLKYSDPVREAVVSLNLAKVWQDLGRLDDADSLLATAYEVFASLLGQQHPRVATTLEARSSLYSDMGKATEAYTSAHEALQIRRQNFLSNVWVLPEPAALKYGAQLRESLGNFLTCATFGGSVADSNEIMVAQEIMATKGIVTDHVIRRSQSLVESGDTAAISLMQDLRTVKQQVSRLFTDGPKSDDHELHRLRIDSLSQKADRLEKELARISARFYDIMATRKSSVQDIASRLPENSLLLEFVRFMRFDHNSGKHSPSYIAVVIDSDSKPQTMTVTNGDDLDSLIMRFREHFSGLESASHPPNEEDMSEFAEISRAIYGLLIEPVEHLITGKDLLLVAPDGLLNLIPFSSLLDGGQRYLIESIPIHYLSTGRDLLRVRDGQGASEDILVMGDPDFDASIAERISGDPVYLSSVETVSENRRNNRSTNAGLSDLKVQRLPGSGVEVKFVTSQWPADRRGKVISFLGAEASEDNFKANASGKKVIHLATHGYYLRLDSIDRACGTAMSDEDRFVGENPLLLSGLLLAGSNLHGRGADSAGVDDGILSAYEVAGLDMRGTELAVLSACETGLGKVRQGEGVYGLRRAFQMAGARTVISSLWQVSDNTTVEVMKGLYSRTNESLPERLQQMALKSIKRLRKRGLPDHPYNWAAFVATGDWQTSTE